MTDPRPKCAYWDTCYRRNPAHLSQFRHPSDDATGNGDDSSDTAPKPAPTPKLKAVARVASVVTKKPTLTKGTQQNDTPASESESVAGKKRPREEPTATAAATAPSSPKPAPAAKPPSPKPFKAAAPTAAPACSAPPTAESTADAVFELTDVNLDEATLKLWHDFHGGCWSVSCPIHSSPSPPSSFFPLASTLLKSMYDGLEFGDDLFHLLEFAWRVHEKLGAGKVDIGQYNPATAKNGAAGGSAASSSAASSSSDVVAPVVMSDADGSAVCSWASSSVRLLHVFAPLLHIALIGPFKILCGFFRKSAPQKIHSLLLDRFFYDSPEVWSAIQQLPSHRSGSPSASSSSSSDPAVHWAWYRDDPRPEFPAAFVGRLTETSPAITLVGPNMLSALLAIIDEEIEEVGGTPTSKKSKLAPGQTTLTSTGGTSDLTLESLRSDLDAFASARGYTLTAKGGKRQPPKRDSAWVKREKKVVCDLDNKVGLVVPYEDDIGWRPVNAENSELAKIVTDIEKAKYSGRKVNFDALDNLVTLSQYANDERDPGMGIELALNLFAKSTTNAINSDICRLLSMGYFLVDRNLYKAVIELHMRHRTKHIRPPGPMGVMPAERKIPPK